MPLARIITRLAEDTDSLAQDLRARGFEVVTKSPDEISSEPADLEITVEECASEEALTSASGIARAHDKCVFIAPGAITENLRPVTVRPLLRQPEPELAHDPVQPVESVEVEQLAEIRQLEDRSETLDEIVIEASEPVVDVSAAATQVSELEAQIIPNFQPPAPLAEEFAELEVAETSAGKGELAEEGELVAREYSAGLQSLPAPISERVLEAPLAAPEIDPGEYSETQAEAVSDLQAISEMQPEAVAQAPAILQADVSLMETEPTSDWPIWHPLAEAEIHAEDSPLPESLVKKTALARPLTSRAKTIFEEPIPQVVPLMQNAVPIRPNTYRQRILQKRVVQNDEAFWKTATVLAMVAVAALLVGASANRFSPLPANVVQRSIEAQQPVPFEKVRIVPALPLDAGNKIGAAELPAAHGSDVARFHPALAVEPAAPRIIPKAADRANDRLVRAKPRRPSAGQPESDMVAEDTVVRYDKKHPPASHTQAQKNSGVKQYSDLD